jgi:hypothetical protein
VIQAQAQTPFAIRGRTLLGAMALVVTLALSAAGGYAVSDASARVTQTTTPAVGAYPIQLGPAPRSTHEEQPFTPIQLGPAPRSTHEESANGVPLHGN